MLAIQVYSLHYDIMHVHLFVTSSFQYIIYEDGLKLGLASLRSALEGA